MPWDAYTYSNSEQAVKDREERAIRDRENLRQREADKGRDDVWYDGNGVRHTGVSKEDLYWSPFHQRYFLTK